MDDSWKSAIGQNAPLVIISFLQTDSTIVNYDKELSSLGTQISRDINCNGLMMDTDDDGGLETDGHVSSCIAMSFGDIQPSVLLQELAAIQEVAAGLREIAAQFQHNVVAQATQNLSNNVLSSTIHYWKKHLSQEVDMALRQGVCLRDLPQEQIIVALSLTLVKGVCQQAPHLLRNLFDVALDYIRRDL
ncbi:BH3 interacting domain death agonist [Scomber scombrus]|uniref:BH3-interacting domain death agonist n=1 Tax=Scomber scombrus TaxID=13677 RepID=A0AAV1NMH4_SCOSC